MAKARGGTRHTDAALSGDALAAFLLGVWTKVDSSNVVAARWLADDQSLEVEFGGPGKPSTFYSYPNVDEGKAEAFARSPSKGGEIWDHFRGTGEVKFF